MNDCDLKTEKAEKTKNLDRIYASNPEQCDQVYHTLGIEAYFHCLLSRCSSSTIMKTKAPWVTARINIVSTSLSLTDMPRMFSLILKRVVVWILETRI